MCIRPITRLADSNHFEHVRVRAGADVVHDIGAGRERLARDRGFPRVDRQKGLRRFAPEALDHGQDTGELLILTHRVGPRPGRFAAYVEDVGPILQELQPVLHGRLGIVEHPSVAE